MTPTAASAYSDSITDRQVRAHSRPSATFSGVVT